VSLFAHRLTLIVERQFCFVVPVLQGQDPAPLVRAQLRALLVGPRDRFQGAFRVVFVPNYTSIAPFERLARAFAIYEALLGAVRKKDALQPSSRVGNERRGSSQSIDYRCGAGSLVAAVTCNGTGAVDKALEASSAVVEFRYGIVGKLGACQAIGSVVGHPVRWSAQRFDRSYVATFIVTQTDLFAARISNAGQSPIWIAREGKPRSRREYHLAGQPVSREVECRLVSARVGHDNRARCRVTLSM
jgi:hypothetical protein